MKPSDTFPKGLAFTPKYMPGGNRVKWIDWKKKETARVADIYKKEEAFLSNKPKASYFKGIINIKKGKGKVSYEMKKLLVKALLEPIPSPFKY